MKNLVLIMILFSAIALNISPAKSQSIRTIQADTIFKGYDTGETKSVKIVNHGTSIIYNHSGKLYEMSAITYEHIREIKLEDSLPVTKFSVDDNCKYIIYNTNVDSITIVADYYTGKTVKVIRGRYYISKDNLFVYIGQAYSGEYVLYNFAKLKLFDLVPIDTFKVKLQKYPNSNPNLRRVNTIYNTNTLIVGTGGHGFYRKDVWDYHTSWYVLNFETDSMKYFEISASQYYVKDIYCSLFVSNDAAYFAISESFYDSLNNKEKQFLIYDSNYKYLFRILQSDLRKSTNDVTLTILFNAIIIDEKYIVFGVEQTINNKVVQRLMVYDLEAQYPRRIIDFDVKAFDCDRGTFMFSNISGCLSTLSLEQVPVQENNKLSNEYSVSYSNNNLLISSDATKLVTISIMNITGEEVESINNIYVTESSNTIPLNTQLANGLYFCIIKTAESTFSRKFMVIK